MKVQKSEASRSEFRNYNYLKERISGDMVLNDIKYVYLDTIKFKHDKIFTL